MSCRSAISRWPKVTCTCISFISANLGRHFGLRKSGSNHFLELVHIMVQLPTRHTHGVEFAPAETSHICQAWQRYWFLFNSEIFREEVQITTAIWIIGISNLRLMQTQRSLLGPHLRQRWRIRFSLLAHHRWMLAIPLLKSRRSSGGCMYFSPNSPYLANIIAQSLIRHIIILSKRLFQSNEHIIKYFFMLLFKLNHIFLH